MTRETSQEQAPRRLASVTPIRNYSDELKAEREWMTGPEVCVAADITYRQLDHWTRTGLLVPEDGQANPGQGNYRRYSPEEVAKARCAAALARAGLHLPKIRQHLDRVSDEGLHIEHGPVSILYVPEQ